MFFNVSNPVNFFQKNTKANDFEIIISYFFSKPFSKFSSVCTVLSPYHIIFQIFKTP